MERIPSEGLVKGLVLRMERLVQSLDKANIAEYVQLYQKPTRLLLFNFLSGISRGFGMAIGFSVVGALFIGLILRLAQLNLPIIGEFIGAIAKIVEKELTGP